MKTDARKCLGAQRISRTSTWLIAFAELRSSSWLLFYTPLPWGTAPSIEPRLRAASQSNTGSISGRGKTLFSLTKGPGRLWYPSNILDNDQPGALSTTARRPGSEADHSPRFSADVKLRGVIPTFHHTHLQESSLYLKPGWTFIHQ
jgi:hypothetical protein